MEVRAEQGPLAGVIVDVPEEIAAHRIEANSGEVALVWNGPEHVCDDNAEYVIWDGPLGHGYVCGVCGALLQVG